ncbi:MAG: helix-turn-helix domain-containing protein [Paludibacteraceae bacterium]|nr:helix-turn-helix domain-containing protein [Paludibacteraceae bacterium]
MELIVTSQENLAMIVKNAVSEAVGVLTLTTKKEEKKNLSLNEALEFLFEKGFRVSKSQLYKLTMENKVPCKRFGRKVIFDPQELQGWAESRVNANTEQSPITIAVAKSATRKMKGYK